MILRSGVVEGISQLNVFTDNDQRLDLEAIHDSVEDSVRAYVEMLRTELKLAGKSS
jgi:hypothetical protein